MRHGFAFVAAVCLVTMAGIPWVAARQAAPARIEPASTDELLAAVRADMQETRADVMAKNLGMTAEEAAKFWPVFNAYQKQQNVIMDDQLKSVQRYIENFETLDVPPRSARSKRIWIAMRE